MRNLYKRLNSYRGAPAQSLKDAIINCKDQSIQLDAKCVFTDRKRKDMYDQTHAALTGIATLRNGLCVPQSEMWNHSLNSEFNSGHSSPLRLKELIQSNGKRANTSSSKPQKAQSDIRRKDFEPTTVIIVIIISILVIPFAVDALYKINKSAPPAPAKSPSRDIPSQIKTEVEAFNQPRLPTLAHGSLNYNTSATPLAPLEIKTPYGSSDYYFVKLVNVSTNRADMELFIHGGRTIEIKVPLGTYIMKYANGTKWYGREHNFGPETVYSKADSLFSFTKDYSGYSGYTVTLYKVQNGNLETEQITAEEF